MRGGAQAHLLGCEDGLHYVVKFKENPQHRRILVNEWLASRFLEYMRISAPEVRDIELTEAFLKTEPSVHIQAANRALPVLPGRHFGSRYPGNPAIDAVYDFLPDSLLAQIVNQDQFLGVLVFDKWACNSDTRQAIFFRRRLRDIPGLGAEYGTRKGFAALMVDHGYIFDGPNWAFPDSPLQGVYFRNVVYKGVRSLTPFEPWISRLSSMPEAVIDQALATVPREWLDGDEDELEAMIERLWRRRNHLQDLVLATIRARANHFPDWTG